MNPAQRVLKLLEAQAFPGTRVNDIAKRVDPGAMLKFLPGDKIGVSFARPGSAAAFKSALKSELGVDDFEDTERGVVFDRGAVK